MIRETLIKTVIFAVLWGLVVLAGVPATPLAYGTVVASFFALNLIAEAVRRA